MYIYNIYNNLICFLSANVKKYNSTMRRLRNIYISILTNLPRTDNETKSVKTMYN